MGREDGYTVGSLWEAGNLDKARKQEADLWMYRGVLFSLAHPIDQKSVVGIWFFTEYICDLLCS